MTCQLRIYTIPAEQLDAFEAFWRAEIVPLRRRFGFEVSGAWSDRRGGTFAWVVCHPEFERAEAEYYASPDRAALSRDPAEFIARSELRMMDPVAYA